MLLTHRPGPPLSRHVEALWYYDAHSAVHHSKERVLPNGRFQIVIDLSGGSGAVCGLRSHYIAIEPAAIQPVVGIVFRPGGARGFFSMPSSDFYNQVVPLDAVWGPRVARVRERMAAVMTAQGKLHALENALLHALKSGNDAQFVLHPAVLYSLKAFRQLPHVLRQIADGGPIDWADVATAGGYYDQAHLIHEFRDFSGLSPGSYIEAERPSPNHVRID